MTEPETKAAPAPAEPPPDSPRVLLGVRVGAVLPLLLGLALYALHPGVREALDEGVTHLVHRDTARLREWGERLGPWAIVGTTALMVIEAFLLPIPAILVTWTNAWLFGPIKGGFLSITQATLAAIICFLLARAFGEPLVVRLVSRRVVLRTREFMVAHGGAAILVARLVPFVPFKGVSYVAGLTRMRLWPFVWATWVGQIPAGIAFSYWGQEIDRPARFAVTGITVVFALAVFGLAVSRATRKKDGGEAPERSTRRAAALLVLAVVLAGGVAGVLASMRSEREPEWPALKRTIRERFPDVRQLSTAELAAWLADASRRPPLLVDARSSEEHAVSTIASATLVTEDDVERFEATTDRTRPLVVFCSVGYRSSALARRLAKDGFRDVQNLEGSIFQWANEGRPIVRGRLPADKVHPYDAKWGSLLEPRLRADLGSGR